MQLRTLVAAGALFAASAPLSAQIRDVQVPPRTFATFTAGMYTLDNIYDPDTDSNWAFGDPALAFGLGLEREVTPGLLIGLEANYSTTDWQQRSGQPEPDAEGDATLTSGFVTGRYLSGGMGNLGAYVKGGIGAFGYDVPTADGANYDFALTYGAGLGYRFAARFSALLEWTQLRAYHEEGDLDQDNTGRHSLLRAGIRVGF